MKTQTENSEKQQISGRINKLFLTGCMLICLTAGWLLASITNEVFSQSNTQKPDSKASTTLMSIPLNGETLPTMMLHEFAVIADQTLNK